MEPQEHLDNQTLFNNEWSYRIVQKNPFSINTSGNCHYRDPYGSGRRCAIGVSIKDEDYDARIDNLAGSTRVWSVARFMPPYIRGADLRFMSRLQSAHDEGAKMRDLPGYEGVLRELATKYNLTIPGENS